MLSQGRLGMDSWTDGSRVTGGQYIVKITLRMFQGPFD